MNLKQKIGSLTIKGNSNWLKKEESISSKRWLKVYSSEIARRVIYLLKERDMSQIELAEVLQVKPQRVNKIVKGKENLTIETIYKLSEALNFQLIIFPKYGWSFSEKSKIEYINLLKKENQNNMKEIDNSISMDDKYSHLKLTGENQYKSWNTNSPFIGEVEIVNEFANE